MRRLHIDPILLSVIALCLFAVAPLTAPSYFSYGHDARHSVYFLQMFDQSIQDGAWYPRWASDMVFGYGYPLWVILAPIPFFAGEAFHLLGLDFVTAVKAVDALAVVAAALSMYLFASSVLDRNVALLAAVAYTYIPYHLVDLYVRSAQAELVAYAFPPLIFWALYQLKQQGIRYAPLVAFSYAGLVLTHILTALLFTPFVGLYMIFLLISPPADTASNIEPKTSRVQFALHSGLAIALAFGLAAVFLLPVAFEQRFLTTEPLIGGFFNYRKHFLSAAQLLSPFWGYGYAGENGTDQFSLQLGLLPVLLGFVALTGWTRQPASDSARRHLILFAGLTFLLVLAMLPLSSSLWEYVSPIVGFIQFPWRMLFIVVFLLAFISGAALSAFPKDWQSAGTSLALAMVFVVGSYAYTEPQRTEAVFNYQTQMEFEVRDRELLGDTIWMTGERPKDSPLVQQYVDGEKLEKAVSLDGNARLQMISHGGQSERIQVTSPEPAQVLFYTRYFPGWIGRIDGQPVPMQPYGDQGLILMSVPQGSHLVEIRYEGTPSQTVGAFMSLLSLFIGILWFLATVKPPPGNMQYWHFKPGLV